MTKMSDIRNKAEGELDTFIKNTREAVRKERFAIAGSRGRNVKAIREARRDVARALTEKRTRA